MRRQDTKVMRKEKPAAQIRSRTAVKVCADGKKTEQCLLLHEHRLELIVDNKSWKHILCTGGDLRALAAGRLFTEGMIGSAGDILDISFSEDESRVEITLAADRKKNTRSPDPFEWEPDWIFAFARQLKKDMPIHRETFAAHSAFLARQGKILYFSEDISRHYAVDKVIGKAVLDGICLSECMLFTSGRVPTDMVGKAVTAGIPLLASRAMPTEEALQLAGVSGLTLIGRVREDSYLLF